MPTLYIANTTKQHHRFAYRVPGMSNPLQRTIRPGQQIALENLSSEDIDAIVKQHERYGMCKAEEFSRRRHIAQTCYSIDKEIDIDRMLQTYELNDDRMDADAQARREQNAAAMSDAIAKKIEEETGVNVGPPARLTTETVEENAGEDGPQVASGVEITSRDLKTAGRRPRTS